MGKLGWPAAALGLVLLLPATWDYMQATDGLVHIPYIAASMLQMPLLLIYTVLAIIVGFKISEALPIWGSALLTIATLGIMTARIAWTPRFIYAPYYMLLAALPVSTLLPYLVEEQYTYVPQKQKYQ